MDRRLCLLFILCLLSFRALGDCSFYARSSSDLPVENARISVYNLSDGSLIFSNLTDSSGAVSYVGGCDGVNSSVSYAVSSYSASVSNFSISSLVPINDFVSARLNLKNTLGEFLEGQDAKVSAYLINPDGSLSFVMDYPTQCIDKPKVVCSGGICNYAAASECPFTDSQGWYYFRGPVYESDGFKYNERYQLQVVINGVMVSGNFSTGLGKQADVNQMEDWASSNGGYIVLALFLGFAVLAIAAVAVVAYSWVRHKARS